MKNEFEELLRRLEADLNEIQQESNVLKRIGRCQERIKVAIKDVSRLEGFELFYHSDGDGTIQLLKERMPGLFRKHFFYRLSFDLEMNRKSSSIEDHRRYCEDKLKEIRQWQTANREFIEYYYSGRNEDDDYEFYFKRKGDIPDIFRESLKGRFENISCGMISTLLAYEDFSEVLKTELEKQEIVLVPALWMGSETQLVEQILGEHAIGHTMINGRPATLEYFVARAEKMYSNVSLKNHEGIAAQIRRRREGSTVYHEEKIRLLNARAAELKEDREFKASRNKRVK